MLCEINAPKCILRFNGRPISDIHLGALISQSMNRWTDQETEDMVRSHAGVRVLCGLEGSDETTDRTSIQDFRKHVGKEGVEELNSIVVVAAKEVGFTDGALCASDTTVQEAPIAYPNRSRTHEEHRGQACWNRKQRSRRE